MTIPVRGWNKTTTDIWSMHELRERGEREREREREGEGEGDSDSLSNNELINWVKLLRALAPWEERKITSLHINTGLARNDWGFLCFMWRMRPFVEVLYFLSQYILKTVKENGKCIYRLFTGLPPLLAQYTYATKNSISKKKKADVDLVSSQHCWRGGGGGAL